MDFKRKYDSLQGQNGMEVSEYLGQSEINVLQEAKPFVVSEYLVFNNIKIPKFLADWILFNTKLIL